MSNLGLPVDWTLDSNICSHNVYYVKLEISPTIDLSARADPLSVPIR